MTDSNSCKSTNLSFSLIPMYEEDNYLNYADRELSGEGGVLKPRSFDFLIDSLIEGLDGNDKFMTCLQGATLRSHISDIYFNNNTLVKMLSRFIARGKGNSIYKIMTILNAYLGVKEVNMDLSTKAGKNVFTYYMTKRCHLTNHSMMDNNERAYFIQECIVMNTLNIIRNEKFDACNGNILLPGERLLLEYASGELIELAMDKGFLDPVNLRKYYEFLVDGNLEKYTKLIPLIMLASRKKKESNRG